MKTEQTAEGGAPAPDATAQATDVADAPEPGAAPDLAELGAYTHLLPEDRRSAVVLGGTPALRTLAIAQFDTVLTVADDEEVPGIPDPRDQEAVVHQAWADVADVVPEPVCAVLGDLVVGRLGSVDDVVELLRAVRGVVAPGGSFVTRAAVVPEGTQPREADLEAATTLVLPERQWLDITADAGFATTRLRLSGQPRYAVAPLYALEVRR